MEEQTNERVTKQTVAEQLQIPELIQHTQDLEKRIPNRTDQQQGQINGVSVIDNLFNKAFNENEGDQHPLKKFGNGVADIALFTQKDLSLPGLAELNKGRLAIYTQILSRLKHMGVDFGENQQKVEDLLNTQMEKTN